MKRGYRYTDERDRITLNVAVNESTGCWEWTGHIGPQGYGRLTINRTVAYSHRFAYETFIGPIPDGLQIDHLCRNRACVNPEHLEPVTPAMNQHRSPATVAATNAQKRECVSGHPFDAANTHISPAGRRICRTCRRDNVRRSYARRAAATRAA